MIAAKKNALLTTGLVVLLGACATSPSSPTVASSDGPLLTNPAPGAASLAAMFGEGTWVYHSEYDAASGRTCRRVQRTDARGQRVLCRHDDGEWRVTTALKSSIPVPGARFDSAPFDTIVPVTPVLEPQGTR